MSYREQRKKREEALFITASCRTISAFALQAGYPAAAYLLNLAELDVAQSEMLPEYLEAIRAFGATATRDS
jgi:hypothetical protein